MTDKLQKIQDGSITLNEFFELTKVIEDEGDVLIFKVDGQRLPGTENMMIITFTGQPEDMIRHDKRDMKEALSLGLEEYFSRKGML